MRMKKDQHESDGLEKVMKQEEDFTETSNKIHVDHTSDT